MAVPFIAPPTDPVIARVTGTVDWDAEATAYGEAYADHCEREDRAAGLTPALSRAARPARVDAAAAAALRWWAGLDATPGHDVAL